ncbi:hypothetical protein DAI22_09g068700 [Oryza sativa Japonica Group]|nr:hypothetical protein DAI22_09g068700 [Oryza sativa Japonica Group]
MWYILDPWLEFILFFFFWFTNPVYTALGLDEHKIGNLQCAGSEAHILYYSLK